MINIQIKEGGERLYVTPYVIKEDGASLKNRIHFYHSREFPPYENGDIDLSFYLFKVNKVLEILNQGFIGFFYARIWKRNRSIYNAVALYVHLRYFLFPYILEYTKTLFSLIRHTGLSRWLFDCIIITPFVAYKYEPHVYIGLPRQLMIVDNDGLVCENYLTPTAKYIRMRVDEMVEKIIQTGIGEEFYEHQYENALKYKQMRDTLGEKEAIEFIIELDT